MPKLILSVHIKPFTEFDIAVNPFNAELNPICHLLALLAHHILHVSKIRVKTTVEAREALRRWSSIGVTEVWDLFLHLHVHNGFGIIPSYLQCLIIEGRLRLKCDGARAETIFRLSAKRTSPFKSVGASVQSTTDSRGVRINDSNAGYTMFQGSVKSTGSLHSPVSPSLPLPCFTVCHHISTGLYFSEAQYYAPPHTCPCEEYATMHQIPH